MGLWRGEKEGMGLDRRESGDTFLQTRVLEESNRSDSLLGDNENVEILIEKHETKFTDRLVSRWERENGGIGWPQKNWWIGGVSDCRGMRREQGIEILGRILRQCEKKRSF